MHKQASPLVYRCCITGKVKNAFIIIASLSQTASRQCLVHDVSENIIMHANQAQVEPPSLRSHLADHNHFADAALVADAARSSAHLDLHNFAVLDNLDSEPEGIDQEQSYVASHMGRIHQADLDKMESIGGEEEDNVAADPVLDMHRNPGLELEDYRADFGDHKLGY